MLEPLLKDLVILEEDGVFIAQMNEFVKGTVNCVIADNLAAHGLAGFVKKKFLGNTYVDSVSLRKMKFSF